MADRTPSLSAPRRVAAETVDALLEATIVGSFSRIGYQVRRRLFGWDATTLEPQRGSERGVALITGATSGLGLATARALARMGMTVIVLGRDADRTRAARASIERDVPGATVDVVVADLARLGDVRRAAGEIIERYDRLDVVVHNAGALVHEHQTTEDALEVTAQTHVVAPFLLTAELLPLLGATTGARVINVASGGMYTARLSVDALAAPDSHDFDGVAAYAQAKRASVVMAAQWAQRTAATRARGVRFHAMHPGWADTPGVESSLPAFHRIVGPILRTPEEGVDTIVWLATADEPLRTNGRFWHDRHVRGTRYVPGTAEPAGEADRLWDWCCARAGVTDPTRIEAPATPATPAVASAPSTGTER